MIFQVSYRTERSMPTVIIFLTKARDLAQGSSTIFLLKYFETSRRVAKMRLSENLEILWFCRLHFLCVGEMRLRNFQFCKLDSSHRVSCMCVEAQVSISVCSVCTHPRAEENWLRCKWYWGKLMGVGTTAFACSKARMS